MSSEPETETNAENVKLRRVLTLPWLIVYGTGVTVGAGIFALIGEILSVSGDRAAASFLLAGIVAGASALSYALLSRVYPKAGGEAHYVRRGLGDTFGKIVGLGVVATGVISSAVIALAFAGYAGTLVNVPAPILMIGVIVFLGAVAWYGVMESVVLAGVVTALEVGALLVVLAFGAPDFLTMEVVAKAFSPSGSFAEFSPVVAGAVLAFFAFVGFEDIVNMAEETRRPRRTVPLAILFTLAITLVIYVALSLVASGVPDRALIADSPAPLSALFEASTGMGGEVIAAIASVAMLNGILVQIVMAARVLYGMASEGQLPRLLSRVDPVRRTPVAATMLTCGLILVLALTLPLTQLAELTSFVILSVFLLVNVSLVVVGRGHEDELLRRFYWWGGVAALMCVAILGFQFYRAVGGAV